MCGLYGYIGNYQIDLAKAIEPIHHRGPDANGYWIHHRGMDKISKDVALGAELGSKVALGFKRLAIIDLQEHSNQPFIDALNNFVIVFNGEIYNYLEIRKELEQEGVRFRTKSDTEVLLASYINWGTNCFERFNGMWACLIYDKLKEQIVLSRDRFGIKPLHYFQFKNEIHVFSEIKQIFGYADFNIEMNPNVLRDYLESGVLDASNETFYKGVYSFPPSHFAILNLNGQLSINPQRYWDLKNAPLDLTYSEAIKRFKELFTQSVELRFRADVPVGACLSGGLDSSSIVSLSGHLGKKINTFSVDNRDPQLSEIQYVKEVVGKYESLNSKVTYNEENDLDLLSKILSIQDEPISGLGVIAQWRVMKLAADNKVTVLLDGQGGDEILGGYRKYLFFYLKELLRKGKILSFTRESLSFLRDKEFNLFDKEGVRRYLNKTNVDEYLSPTALSLEKKHNIGISGASGFAQKSYEDIYFYSYPQLLRYEDRNSMAFSLESRMPFLDYRLVEFVYSLPSTYKLRKGFTKAILRDSMKGILPDSVRLRRSKLGFATPEKEWMQNVHRSYFLDYFKNMSNPYINTERLYFDFEQRSIKLDYKSLLRIFLFDYWYQLSIAN